MKKQRTAKASPAHHRVLVVITVAGLGLVGCTVGPDYVRPEADGGFN